MFLARLNQVLNEADWIKGDDGVHRQEADHRAHMASQLPVAASEKGSIKTNERRKLATAVPRYMKASKEIIATINELIDIAIDKETMQQYNTILDTYTTLQLKFVNVVGQHLETFDADLR